jgi:hypothetical protein
VSKSEIKFGNFRPQSFGVDSDRSWTRFNENLQVSFKLQVSKFHRNRLFSLLGPITKAPSAYKHVKEACKLKKDLCIQGSIELAHKESFAAISFPSTFQIRLPIIHPNKNIGEKDSHRPWAST